MLLMASAFVADALADDEELLASDPSLY